MPLLGKKVFTIGANSPKKESEDAPYMIPHTKERFQSKSEYEKRKDLYSQNIWTCRATGHTNLTHEEAYKSEISITEQLSSQFPKCFEKDVLEVVHHNTVSLETLVDKAWWKLHQQFVVGEKVNLKVKVADRLIPAKVIAVDSSHSENKANGSCNSPSSDKENSTDEKEKDHSPKKWVPPKMLPYNYSIELENEAKVIHSVPGADLQRVEKAPSKDLLRLFIRVSALRSGTTATSPWVVNADLVKQYKLVSKFADFFLSPVKMSEALKKAEENGNKRKLSNGACKSAAKKLKLDKSGEKSKKEQQLKTVQLNKKVKDKDSTPKSKKDKSTPKQKTPLKKISASPKKKSQDSAIVVSDTDSEDGITLAKLKRQSSGANGGSDVPLSQLAEQSTPKKKKKGSESSDEDIPLSKITPSTPKKLSPKKMTTGTPKKPVSSNNKNNTSLKKSTKKKKDKDADKKKGGMKQVTLYDLTKKGKTVVSTPQKKSPPKTPKSPSKPPPTPAIVRRLLNMKRETLNEKMKYSMLLKKAVSVLTAAQIKNLPDKLKDEFEHKKRFIEEKQKMAKMTPEEREAYLKEKREQAKQIQKQKLLQKLKDKRRRFEDTDLDLTPLPQATLVPTPDGFPNTLFGDVAMVTEFINCFGGLLMPESEYPIYTDALMKALVGGSSGFTYLSRVLNVLLQTLLQDQIAKGYKELNTQLSDIAVSAYTASELVRLCLRCEDKEEDENEGDVPEEYIHLLKDSEFYQLDVEQKLCVLRGLCSRVLATYSVQDYMEEQQRAANVLTRQKNTEMKQIAAQKKTGKQNTPGDKTDKKGKEDKPAVTQSGTLSINSFYGKEEEDSAEDSTNWRSIVKRRRELAAKAAAEKEKLEKEKMAMRQKEYQEEKQKEKMRKKQEQIAEAINLARMVLRQETVGTDRNHDRYWVFTNTTPGLYVEKGWMGEEVNYSVKVEVPKGDSDEEESSESDEEEEEDNSAVKEENSTAPHKTVYRARRHVIEKSIPHAGQNLWFTYRSQKALDGLLKALHPQGIRESQLKTEIKRRYDDISRAIVQAQRTNLELRDSDGDVEMMAGFKKELSDMELRLRNGGLGGVSDFDEWESKLMDATEIADMSECLLQVKDGILEKFLQGFMKPSNKSSETEKKEEISDEEGSKNNDVVTEKHPEREAKREKSIREWREAVEGCQTLSRLHVLMAMLDCCIKWEKSAENAKCKICRKKCDETRLLLCDECNQAFHMYCLRPALSKLPSGDWFCPACMPRRPQSRPLESESEAEENEDKEDVCRECGGSDKLIFCTKCPAAFHTQCHNPPLRHPPRGVWECCDCKNGANDRRRGKYARKAPKRNYRQEMTASEEEEDEEEEEESEEEVTPQRTRSHPGRPKGSTRSRDKSQTSSQPSGHTRSRSGNQRDGSFNQTPASRTSRRGPSELSLCEEILHKVMKHKSSWPFLEPVDKKSVPDYYTVIKKPMDFQTMLKKCTRLSYASPQEFIEDAALVFENAEAYNKPDSEVFNCMREVEKVFKDALHKMLPDWPFYRTVAEKEENSSGSDTGRRRSRNK
ncbi:tyrosine-protein kinase BAZ1B-like isoform X2 [Physella acuta]|uniref:tyrosine-protein kinase BAZ1B-like isoform X2 n=1 Tax=Physella acuta TaxID=109671 RepID=UPI0027DE4AFA|nr:tyrosine-protein kinase BAZ1B-like isoform X2 [Physella acuta]